MSELVVFCLWMEFCYFTRQFIHVHVTLSWTSSRNINLWFSRTSTKRQTDRQTVHTLTLISTSQQQPPLYSGHFLLSPRWLLSVEKFNCISSLAGPYLFTCHCKRSIEPLLKSTARLEDCWKKEV